MININRDSIASAARADLLAMPLASITDTLAACDDDFDAITSLYLDELRDDLDSAIELFMLDDPSLDDAAIDRHLDARFAILAADRPFLYDTIIATIRLRIDRAY